MGRGTGAGLRLLAGVAKTVGWGFDLNVESGTNDCRS